VTIIRSSSQFGRVLHEQEVASELQLSLLDVAANPLFRDLIKLRSQELTIEIANLEDDKNMTDEEFRAAYRLCRMEIAVYNDLVQFLEDSLQHIQQFQSGDS